MEVDRAVEATMRAQKKWARLAAEERGKYLGEVAAKIRDRADFLALIITEGTGKTAWSIAAILNYLKEIAEAAVRRGRVCLHPFDGRDCRQRVGGGHGHVRRAGRQDRNPVIHRQEYP